MSEPASGMQAQTSAVNSQTRSVEQIPGIDAQSPGVVQTSTVGEEHGSAGSRFHSINSQEVMSTSDIQSPNTVAHCQSPQTEADVVTPDSSVSHGGSSIGVSTPPQAATTSPVITHTPPGQYLTPTQRRLRHQAYIREVSGLDLSNPRSFTRFPLAEQEAAIERIRATFPEYREYLAARSMLITLIGRWAARERGRIARQRNTP
ncbi:hypothetical protein K440DRAFT_640792 [Wilcoxina mikolae CBS 423.85]|nr:hypothetical protein K440DRAFT_640792 [Wilcoxina mikolae CBS 423.85]